MNGCTFFAGDQVSTKVSKDYSSHSQVPVLRNRVPSYHMRELVRGRFMVKSKEITLLECIGEGQNEPAIRGPCVHLKMILFTQRSLELSTRPGSDGSIEMWLSKLLKVSYFIFSAHCHM